MEQAWKGITLEMEGIRNLYGLGNYFMEPGTSDGDWVGRVWDPLPDKEGNALRGFNGGATSYAQFQSMVGVGGMIDWTNPAAGDYWHDVKRQPLYQLGVTDFWTDLGEPEMYPNDCYYGFSEIGQQRHSDIHNAYDLRWD